MLRNQEISTRKVCLRADMLDSAMQPSTLQLRWLGEVVLMSDMELFALHIQTLAKPSKENLNELYCGPYILMQCPMPHSE